MRRRPEPSTSPQPLPTRRMLAAAAMGIPLPPDAPFPAGPVPRPPPTPPAIPALYAAHAGRAHMKKPPPAYTAEVQARLDESNRLKAHASAGAAGEPASLVPTGHAAVEKEAGGCGQGASQQGESRRGVRELFITADWRRGIVARGRVTWYLGQVGR